MDRKYGDKHGGDGRPRSWELSRRRVIGAFTGAVAAFGVTPLLAACGGGGSAAPAEPTKATGAQGSTPAPAATAGLSGQLGLVMWSHFVPAYDTWFDKWATDWGTKNKVQVTVDHVPVADLPARLAAEAAAKTGHDIIQFEGQVLTYRYEKLLVDVGEHVDFATKKYGAANKLAKDTSFINNTWRAVPDFYVIIAPMVRDDLMATIGNPKIETWDDVRQAGAKLKKTGNEAGLAISNCNDANHNWRAIMWAYGASETTADGKAPNVNTKEFRDFLTFAKAFYQEAITPEVFAWDDTSDNRWLGSGQGGFIHDAISSLRSIQPPKDKPDAERQKLYDSISIRPPLKGPSGQLVMPDVALFSQWDFSKAKPAAKQFLHDYLDNWKEAFTQSTGYNMPFYEDLLKKPMPILGEDPKYNVLQDYKGDAIHTFGYPGPPNAAAQEVMINYHIPQLVGIYVRGNTSLDDVIKEAQNRLQPIYDKYK